MNDILKVSNALLTCVPRHGVQNIQSYLFQIIILCKEELKYHINFNFHCALNIHCCVPILKTKQLRFRGEMIAVYCKNHTEHI
jgi:hypothetical protein